MPENGHRHYTVRTTRSYWSRGQYKSGNEQCRKIAIDITRSHRQDLIGREGYTKGVRAGHYRECERWHHGANYSNQSIPNRYLGYTNRPRVGDAFTLRPETTFRQEHKSEMNEKDASQCKKITKLYKRSITVLERVIRQRDILNKIVRIQNKPIRQFEKVNECLIQEHLQQSFLIEEQRRRGGSPAIRTQASKDI